MATNPKSLFDDGERRILEALDRAVRNKPVLALLDSAAERLRRKLALDPKAVMAWETLPLSLFEGGLPDGIASSWVFILRAGARTGAERHPNSHQRTLSYGGTGDLQTQARLAGRWRSRPLAPGFERPLDERWTSIPPGTWHQAVVAGGDWVVVSFHTARADELIEERPDPADARETRRRRYA
jgi:hypothetical protein